ncbi:DedA family protein [candidate division TA06 bacterium]|nr:DedA family protein [candidate division TA06 bacterium]
MSMEQLANTLASQGGWWAYLTIFTATFLEGVFPPAPSDVVVIFCAILVGQNQLHWFPGFLSAFLGGSLGALLVYWIGIKKGRDYFLSKPRPFLSPSRLILMEGHFARYGNLILALNRAVVGGRSFGFLIAGLTGYSFKKVLLYGLPGIALWYGLLFCLGIFFGAQAKQFVNVIIIVVMSLLALSLVSALVTKKLIK